MRPGFLKGTLCMQSLQPKFTALIITTRLSRTLRGQFKVNQFIIDLLTTSLMSAVRPEKKSPNVYKSCSKMISLEK